MTKITTPTVLKQISSQAIPITNGLLEVLSMSVIPTIFFDSHERVEGLMIIGGWNGNFKVFHSGNFPPKSESRFKRLKPKIFSFKESVASSDVLAFFELNNLRALTLQEGLCLANQVNRKYTGSSLVLLGSPFNDPEEFIPYLRKSPMDEWVHLHNSTEVLKPHFTFAATRK